ncbi:hypothetical protein HDE78_002649 [Rhodanobacter sp. K2T2]|nr:hypothetical protein [Rhodanobacter sp. K2T2]
MSAPYSPYAMRQDFAIGTRVMVSAIGGGWRDDCLGVISSAPESIQTLQGVDYSYWVKFDTPQHDLSNDGPYYKAQILSRCLTKEA